MALPVEPQCNVWILRGIRRTCEERYGASGMQAIAASLDAETRRATIEPVLLTESWYPERYILSWYRAIHEGPGRRDDEEIRVVIRGMMGKGFNLIHKFFMSTLVSIESPKLIERLPSLWRKDHDTGQIEGRSDTRALLIELSDHVYTEDRLASVAIAECYLVGANLCRVPGGGRLSMTPRPTGRRRLEMRISW